MRYTVEGFQQSVLVECGLDAGDALILRWFVDFQNTGRMVTKYFDGVLMYWVKYQAMIDDLPILKILNRDSLARRFERLAVVGILVKQVEKKANGTYTYFGVGPKFESLFKPPDLKVEWPPDSKVVSPPDSKVDPKDPSNKKNPDTSKTELNTSSSATVVADEFIHKWKDSLEELKRIHDFQVPAHDLLGNVPCTKTLLQIIQYLEEISRGTFLRSIGYRGHVKLPMMMVKDVCDFIRKRVDVFLEALEPDKFPMSKGALKVVTAVGFFRNPKTGHSWLMWTIENESRVRPLRDAVVEEACLKIDVSNDLKYDYTDLLGMKWEEVAPALLWVHSQIAEYLKNPDRTLIVNHEWFDSEEMILRGFHKFLSGFDHVGPGHLNSQKIWNLFRNQVLKGHGVDLFMIDPEVLEEVRLQQVAYDVPPGPGKSEFRRETVYDEVEDSLSVVHRLRGSGAYDPKMLWETHREQWVRKYGSVEWVDLTPHSMNDDGVASDEQDVVESGGVIDDSKGIALLAGKGGTR